MTDTKELCAAEPLLCNTPTCTVLAQPIALETLRNIVFANLKVGETDQTLSNIGGGIPPLQFNDVDHSVSEDSSPQIENRTGARVDSVQNSLEQNCLDGKELEFPCETCGLKFKQPNRLRNHMRVHTGERPFTCEQCGKTFKRRSHVKSHYIRIHCDEKPHQCDVCGMCFKELYELQKHQRVHSDERPYKCPICAKRFKRSYSIKAHLRVHTNDKPYTCETCEKCFKRQESLKKHYEVHKGEKPYQCVTCGNCYRRADTLRKHENVHVSHSHDLSEGTSSLLSHSQLLQPSQLDYSDLSGISQSLELSHPPPPTPPPISDLSDRHTVENKLFLSSLSCIEVLNLLDNMGLSQHKESFKNERVDGELFAECDDEILKNDLKVNSKLQRLRLMKVITGKHSVQAILQNQDPYGGCASIVHSND